MWPFLPPSHPRLGEIVQSLRRRECVDCGPGNSRRAPQLNSKRAVGWFALSDEAARAPGGYKDLFSHLGISILLPPSYHQQPIFNFRNLSQGKVLSTLPQPHFLSPQALRVLIYSSTKHFVTVSIFFSFSSFPAPSPGLALPVLQRRQSRIGHLPLLHPSLQSPSTVYTFLTLRPSPHG